MKFTALLLASFGSLKMVSADTSPRDTMDMIVNLGTGNQDDVDEYAGFRVFNNFYPGMNARDLAIRYQTCLQYHKAHDSFPQNVYSGGNADNIDWVLDRPITDYDDGWFGDAAHSSNGKSHKYWICHGTNSATNTHTDNIVDYNSLADEKKTGGHFKNGGNHNSGHAYYDHLVQMWDNDLSLCGCEGSAEANAAPTPAPTPAPGNPTPSPAPDETSVWVEGINTPETTYQCHESDFKLYKDADTIYVGSCKQPKWRVNHPDVRANWLPSEKRYDLADMGASATTSDGEWELDSAGRKTIFRENTGSVYTFPWCCECV